MNRAPAAGCEVTKSFLSGMRKYPWVPGEEARKALCANKTSPFY